MELKIYDQKGRACISTQGAQLLSWQNEEGQELIWQRDPAFWPRCAPLLFPVIGNCQNDELLIKNKAYPMPKHGFLREQEFTVLWQTETELVLEYRHGEKDVALYPWPFAFRAHHRLVEGQLHLHYEVENLAEEDMYFCFGGHPGFHLPLGEDAKFSDYVVHFPKDKVLETVTYNFSAKAFDPALRKSISLAEGDLPLSRELFAEDALFMPRLQSTEVELVNRFSRRGLHFAFAGFPSLALWSPYPAEAPFLCLEPWQGSAVWTDENNSLEEKRDVQKLAPQQFREYKITLTYLEGKNEK